MLEVCGPVSGPGAPASRASRARRFCHTRSAGQLHPSVPSQFRLHSDETPRPWRQVAQFFLKTRDAPSPSVSWYIFQVFSCLAPSLAAAGPPLTSDHGSCYRGEGRSIYRAFQRRRSQDRVEKWRAKGQREGRGGCLGCVLGTKSLPPFSCDTTSIDQLISASSHMPAPSSTRCRPLPLCPP